VREQKDIKGVKNDWGMKGLPKNRLPERKFKNWSYLPSLVNRDSRLGHPHRKVKKQLQRPKGNRKVHRFLPGDQLQGVSGKREGPQRVDGGFEDKQTSI